MPGISDVSCFYSPRLSSIDQMQKDATPAHSSWFFPHDCMLMQYMLSILWPYVCLFVTSLSSVRTSTYIIKQTMLCGSLGTLVFWCQWCWNPM